MSEGGGGALDKSPQHIVFTSHNVGQSNGGPLVAIVLGEGCGVRVRSEG